MNGCDDVFLEIWRTYPRIYFWTMHHSNHCKVLRHAENKSEAIHSHKVKRKFVTGRCFVTWQCVPSHSRVYHQQLSSEVGTFRALCLQLGPSDFHIFQLLKNASRERWFCRLRRGETSRAHGLRPQQKKKERKKIDITLWACRPVS